MATKHSLSQAIRDGGRFYFDNPSVDQVLAMVLTLSGEVWGLRERLAAFEAAAGRKDMVAPGELDRLDFTDAEELQLAALRKEFLASLFGILELPRPAAVATPRASGTAGKRRSRAPASKRGRRKK